MFGIPREILPDIQPSSSLFGTTSNLDFLPDGIPIYGVAGDQQASLVGHRCNIPGLAKCTFGTGAFLLQHTGKKIIHSKHGLLTTLAATLSNDLEYALEGSVFIAGAAIQFLRDSLGFFNASADSENL
ncbi:MAG: glycerol kinase, partial [Planctomycetia bacterium]